MSKVSSTQELGLVLSSPPAVADTMLQVGCQGQPRRFPLTPHLIMREVRAAALELFVGGDSIPQEGLCSLYHPGFHAELPLGSHLPLFSPAVIIVIMQSEGVCILTFLNERRKQK